MVAHPHNSQTTTCSVNGCLHHLLLRTFRVSRKLASDLNFDLFWYNRKNCFWNQLVRKNKICLLREDVTSRHCKQPRVTRTRANEEYSATGRRWNDRESVPRARPRVRSDE